MVKRKRTTRPETFYIPREVQWLRDEHLSELASGRIRLWKPPRSNQAHRRQQATFLALLTELALLPDGASVWWIYGPPRRFLRQARKRIWHWRDPVSGNHYWVQDSPDGPVAAPFEWQETE